MLNNINIIPVGSIDPDILLYLKKRISELFETEANILEKIDLPVDSYDKERNQYNASLALNNITSGLKIKDLENINVAILKDDIYSPTFNFIFGISTDFPKVCLVSIARLNQFFYTLPGFVEQSSDKNKPGRLKRNDREVYKERILKETVHEIGHTIGLHHCDDNKCVMYFSNSLLDTDRKGAKFCLRCFEKILKYIAD